MRQILRGSCKEYGMMRTLSIVVFIIAGAYIAVCLLISACYPVLRARLVPEENLLCWSDFPHEDHTFVIYSEDQAVIFRTIENKFLLPFEKAKYPVIKQQYSFHTTDDTKTGYREGLKEVSVYEVSEIAKTMNECFVVKDHYLKEYWVIENLHKGFSMCSYYFGFYKNGDLLSKATQYAFHEPYENGYIFLFKGDENPYFSDREVPHMSLGLN